MTTHQKNECPGGAGQIVKTLSDNASHFIAETIAVVNHSEFPRYSVFALLVLAAALTLGSCNDL